MKVGQIAGQRVAMLLYGASGVGKTYLASRLDNVLLIDVEGGLLSAPSEMEYLSGADLKTAFDGSFPEGSVATKAESVQDLQRIYGFLTRNGTKRFDTVVIDSITEVQKRVAEDLTRRFSSAVTQKFTSDNGSQENFHVLTQQGWMALQTRTRDVFRSFREIPSTTVVFTALEEMVSDSEGAGYVQPLLDGRKNLPDLEAMLDVGIRLSQVMARTARGVASQRLFQCARTPNLWAKVRGGLLDATEPVTERGLQELLDKIAQNKKNNDPNVSVSSPS